MAETFKNASGVVRYRKATGTGASTDPLVLHNNIDNTVGTGTPQVGFTFTDESVCAQALPAFTAAGLNMRKTLPTSVFTNTAGALVYIPLEPNNAVALQFIVRHASLITSKSGTARLWVVKPADCPTAFTGQPSDYTEYNVTPVGDLTIGTSSSPPVVALTDSLMGGAQTAFADVLTFDSKIDAARYNLEGGTTGIKGTLTIDYYGAVGLIVAINIGTLTGIRIGTAGL
jgi:hypothetical protein